MTGVRLAVALAAVVLVAGCASGSTDTTTSANGETGWHGTGVSKGYPMPDLQFTDTEGQQVTPAEVARTPVTLIFFGYTHCPDICNVVLANFASALRGATPAVRKDVRMLFVTTDPARDTPDVVRDYLDRFDPTYEGLVAPVGTYEKPDGSQGGNYMVSHGTYTTAFLHGAARVVWSADTPVADLRADLTRLTRLA
jgi:protein SCO1/2